MKRIIIALTLFLQGFAVAYNAGILPYDYINGQAYFLLGLESHRDWHDFGGGSKGQDIVGMQPADFIKNAINTATREFQEESLMVYPSSETKKAIVRASQPNQFGFTKLIHDTKPAAPGDYYLFAVNFENIPDRKGNIGLHSAADFRNRLTQLKNKHGNQWLRHHGAEKIDFVRVRAIDFLQALQEIQNNNINADGSVTIPALSQSVTNVKIWKTFVNLLRRNLPQAQQLVQDIINHQ
ncbi:hypothetical protein H0X48_03545 [Candidatus Dependentiae bacterium]|nr:hypothetical protein [Candidatus Dependentiae bacterium]